MLYFSQKEDNFAGDATDAIKNPENVEEQQRMNHHRMEVSYKPGPLSKKKLLRGKYFAK